MSSEFLEKIRKIIVILLVLFVSILNTWIAFCTLPVHAATVTPTGNIIVEVEGAVNDYCNRNIKVYSGDAASLKCAILTMDENVDVKNMNALLYTTEVYQEFTYYAVTSDTWPNNPQNNNESVNKMTSSGMGKITLSDGTIVRYSVAGVGKNDWSIISNTPCYDPISGLSSLASAEQAKIFLEHLLVVGDLKPNNGGSDFDPHDDAYAFTGFSMSGKTATWTGTTERSYLLDMDVEEWVNYTYGFASSEDQEVSSFIDAEAHFPTSDKKLALPWDEMEANKKEGEFIRQVNIIPCYGTSGAGFYFGSPVCVYFDKNGKIESIVQNTVPTDGEVIGNNISLIGFRYDTSFQAEFVDVWSNAVNCSAFDLGGSQYLSLGVKALYYNGQSKDIDFVSLDRKNLVWDKTFDSFKSFNGSGIKQLFFTPYIKTGVNNPWNKGNSIVIDFDVNGNATSSFDTGDDGTVHLSDFKLTGVVWNKPMLAYGTITWTGTTANSDLSVVPDSDTLVVCSYPVYDSSLNESYETYDTVTIGKGSIRVYIDSLIDKYTNAGKTWNGEMWLTPCYKKGGVLYMGEPVIVNCIKGSVSDIEVDESTGTANQIDKTDENKSYADAVLSSGNNFFSIVKGLIASMQQLPELIATLFSFLPGWVNALIAGSIFIIFVCRILGR